MHNRFENKGKRWYCCMYDHLKWVIWLFLVETCQIIYFVQNSMWSWITSQMGVFSLKCSWPVVWEYRTTHSFLLSKHIHITRYPILLQQGCPKICIHHDANGKMFEGVCNFCTSNYLAHIHVNLACQPNSSSIGLPCFHVISV